VSAFRVLYRFRRGVGDQMSSGFSDLHQEAAASSRRL